MWEPYRRVLSVPGAWAFSLAGVVARLPIAMVSLGIVLLVSDARGSYGAAGAVAATYLVANGVCAVLQGRVLDRFRQGVVLSSLMTVSALAMVALMLAVQLDWGLLAAHVAAAVSGATLPQVGSAVRARWSHVLGDPARIQTAFALEGALDESVFVAGPILVTMLATSVHPLAGLGTAAAVGLVGTFTLSLQRGTEPPPHAADPETGARAPLPWRVLAPNAVVALCLGVMFGSAEVSTVAFAEELGDKSRAGVLLALWAFGSLSAGLITGAIPWRRGPATRVLGGSAALVVVMTPLTFVDSLVTMGAMLLVAGFAIAPTLIASMALTEQSAPPGRLTEAMAIVHTGIVAGVAPGAALAGVVIDHRGASAAYVVAGAAAALATLCALTLPRRPMTRASAPPADEPAGVGSAPRRTDQSPLRSPRSRSTDGAPHPRRDE